MHQRAGLDPIKLLLFGISFLSYRMKELGRLNIFFKGTYYFQCNREEFWVSQVIDFE